MSNPTPSPQTSQHPSIHLNIEDWLPYLAESDATEAQKIALIETLWDILLVFLDHGWKLGNGKNIGGKDLDLTAALREAVIHSEETRKPEQEAV